MNPEILQKLDDTVKRRITLGERPEDAVPAACLEVGVRLERDVEQNLIEVLRYIVDEPKHRIARKLLTQAIRRGMREGKATKDAVRLGQEQTGIKLGPSGEKALIEALDQERDRMRNMLVEVVSSEEFRELQGERCVRFQLNGKDGWACCKCQEHNRKNQDACVMCGHGRCYK